MPNGASSDAKARVVNKIANDVKIIIFNVRVFSLGSDMPKLESVMFNGNKFSKIDIVQSASRCMRLAPGKKSAKILIPCIVKDDDIEGEGDYQNLRRFLASMASTDHTITEEIVLREKGEDRPDYKIKIDPILKGFV